MCSPLQVVSYAKFLYPTNALVTQKTDGHGPPPQPRPSMPRALPASRYKPAAAKPAPTGTELGTLTGAWVTPCGSRAESHLNPQPQVETEASLGLGSGLSGQKGLLTEQTRSQAVQRSCVHRWLFGLGHPLQDALPFHPRWELLPHPMGPGTGPPAQRDPRSTTPTPGSGLPSAYRW